MLGLWILKPELLQALLELAGTEGWPPGTTRLPDSKGLRPPGGSEGGLGPARVLGSHFQLLEELRPFRAPLCHKGWGRGQKADRAELQAPHHISRTALYLSYGLGCQ